MNLSNLRDMVKDRKTVLQSMRLQRSWFDLAAEQQHKRGLGAELSQFLSHLQLDN